MRKFGIEHAQFEQRTELRSQSRRQLVSRDFRARHRRGGVIRRDHPGQIRVHAEEHRDAIQIQQKREHDRENRVEAQKRREPEQHAERERRRRPLRRVVDVQQRAQPPPDQRLRQMDHAVERWPKWLYP